MNLQLVKKKEKKKRKRIHKRKVLGILEKREEKEGIYENWENKIEKKRRREEDKSCLTNFY